MSIKSRRKLPLGIQTFSTLREEGCYYVDKTAFASQLIEQGNYYFLSRPRRFGKSLFLDTLKELFEANEPLFRGLFIHPLWNWQIRYPVIHLSFAAGVLRSRAELETKIGELLTDNESRLGVRSPHQSISGRFHGLIREAHAHSGQRVVVLIDEYDKPILDNLTEPEIARAMRDDLRNLYSTIKGADAHLRFVLLTGVSKFSKVSLFSGLNNLNDITISPQYSALCGYTEHDLDTVFAAELFDLDRDEIRRWYNGYHWTGETVYNPFDVLLLFQQRQFRPWWFETATPTFLVDLLKQRHTWLPQLGQMETDAALLSALDVDHLTTEALLFQTGYLTIGCEKVINGNYFYQLRYPNYEVYQSLNSII